MSHEYNKELLSEVFDITKARKVEGTHYNTYFIGHDGSLFHIQGGLSSRYIAFDNGGRIIYNDYVLSNCDHMVIINKYDTNGNWIYRHTIRTNGWTCHDEEKLISDDEIWREYDEHNHVTLNRTSDGKVVTCQYEYDELGRVVRRDDSDGEYILFEYYEDGTHREYGQNPWGSFDITKDAAGKVVKYNMEAYGR